MFLGLPKWCQNGTLLVCPKITPSSQFPSKNPRTVKWDMYTEIALRWSRNAVYIKLLLSFFSSLLTRNMGRRLDDKHMLFGSHSQWVHCFRFASVVCPFAFLCVNTLNNKSSQAFKLIDQIPTGHSLFWVAVCSFPFEFKVINRQWAQLSVFSLSSSPSRYSYPILILSTLIVVRVCWSWHVLFYVNICLIGNFHNYTHPCSCSLLKIKGRNLKSSRLANCGIVIVNQKFTKSGATRKVRVMPEIARNRGVYSIPAASCLFFRLIINKAPKRR